MYLASSPLSLMYLHLNVFLGHPRTTVEEQIIEIMLSWVLWFKHVQTCSNQPQDCMAAHRDLRATCRLSRSRHGMPESSNYLDHFRSNSCIFMYSIRILFLSCTDRFWKQLLLQADLMQKFGRMLSLSLSLPGCTSPSRLQCCAVLREQGDDMTVVLKFLNHSPSSRQRCAKSSWHPLV